MTTTSRRVTASKVSDFRHFEAAMAAGTDAPFAPQVLNHLYLKLEFRPEFENARTAENARGFLRSVARAAIASHLLAVRYEGELLEVQGSMLHVALAAGRSNALFFIANLHTALRTIFDNQHSRVSGWRMTVDSGTTIVVAGRGVHGDQSKVSLGESANRPAKHLYAQLELPEDQRQLKRFFVGVRDEHGQWRHGSLDAISSETALGSAAGREARLKEPNLDFINLQGEAGRVQADAAPIAPAGSPGSPSADQPITFYGWVMRADLDGFTARVEECFGDESQLQSLAEEFYGIMDAGARFIERHRETLAQLPWAGDNFTAAAVFRSKQEYDRAIPTRLIEATLDFEKEMKEEANLNGFRGWAHGVAGGDVHGNSGGNVYLAGVEVDGRRFLVGVGEGFGRSTQAFGDVNPSASEIVVYEPDWARLVETYRSEFEPATTRRGKESTLYRVAHSNDLIRRRARRDSVNTSSLISIAPGVSQAVTARPYAK